MTAIAAAIAAATAAATAIAAAATPSRASIRRPGRAIPTIPRLRNYQELERRNQQQGNRGDWRRDRRRRPPGLARDNRDDRGDWRGDRRGDRRDWNRGWRNDRRYDWSSWRNSNRNLFRVSPYYSPYRN